MPHEGGYKMSVGIIQKILKQIDQSRFGSVKIIFNSSTIDSSGNRTFDYQLINDLASLNFVIDNGYLLLNQNECGINCLVFDDVKQVVAYYNS